ncbi:substrate-binding periplasmic protein [Hydrogenophaga sp. R2]|uniref:substrate-binding periplasmic protein n=1 Tax=Hydrogenophaga sp. R2 TaxID=3132827 RepID=UPI003CF85318
MRRLPALAAALSLVLPGPAAAQSPAATSASPALTVCVSEDNAPLSTLRRGQVEGFDVLVARAVAAELGRELRLVPFEPEIEKESLLTHEVNALLSAGVCDLASGFPLLKSDLGAPTRERFKTADHPGAKRKRDRPYITLGTLVPSQPYLGSALQVVQRSGLPPAQTLAGLRGQKVAAVAGTLEGTLVAMHGGGALSGQMVSLGQREDLWAALQQGRIDAALVPSTTVDAWRRRHAQGGTLPLQLGTPRALGVNFGFVALAPRQDMLDAVNRVVTRSRASGELQRWATESGLSWQAPTEPAVVDSLKLDDWLAP